MLSSGLGLDILTPTGVLFLNLFEDRGRTMRTGIIRDDRCLQHMPGNGHPEGPSRLQAVYDMLDRMPPSGLILIPAEVASVEELALVHTPGYIQQVLRTSEQAYTFFAPETPVSSGSYLAARLAVGGLPSGA